MEGDFMESVKELLAENNLTIKEISKKSSISETTLSSAFKRPVETWSVRTLKALAHSLYMQVDDLLRILMPEEFKLEIDDEKHIIQGVKIPDDMFLDVKASVRYNVMEGWKPTKKDINYLVERLQSDDPIVEKEMKDLWKI